MFVHNALIPMEDLGDGIRRKVLAHSDNMMSVEVYFEKGAIGAMHSHPHEQLTYVLSGVFEFTIGNEKRVVKAGDTMYKEPEIEHGCVCIDEGVLIDTFTPMRRDFL
uniref:cupin domain-containing protein n=1 Tax=Thaumasiovibrio subtropicus TaxID=1891207 RepID=UPI000B35AB01|nr:cupin domain-containing protein [Thaumasiovibrio subtropicus]